MKTARLRQKETFKNYPELKNKWKNALKQTYQEHSEIIEKSHDKAYQTMKERGFVSKPEQQMIQLLKNKYGTDDIMEQYRDIRYSKPGTNYRYACDCYIKSLDLFIEYNGKRFHPNESDRQNLLREIERFKLRYPNTSIEQCQAFALLHAPKNDRTKQQVAKDNNLNYLVVTDEFRELYDNKILYNILRGIMQPDFYLSLLSCIVSEILRRYFIKP